jgi:hypothetical protein
VYNSLFIATKDEGHSIKTRGPKTAIYHSIIASLGSRDSRSVDASNGGELIIENSIIEQGPFSSNGQLIGYALEGRKHSTNSVKLEGNLFLLERIGYNTIVATDSKPVNQVITNNIIVSDRQPEKLSEQNVWFNSRPKASVVGYPFLPKSFCNNNFELCSTLKQPKESK